MAGLNPLFCPLFPREFLEPARVEVRPQDGGSAFGAAVAGRAAGP